jgi:hypothetical protein
MTVTEPIFMKLSLVQKLLVKSYYAEAHENPRV